MLPPRLSFVTGTFDHRVCQCKRKLETSSIPYLLTKPEFNSSFSPFKLKRLASYANKMLDYHIIFDMLPPIAQLYFTSRLKPAVSIKGVQSTILLAIWLQRKALENVKKELGLPAGQLLAMFVKIVRKVLAYFRRILEGAVKKSIPQTYAVAQEDGVNKEQIEKYAPLQSSLNDKLREGGEQVDKELKEKQRALVDALPLDKYEIETRATGWDEVVKPVRCTLVKSGDKGLIVSAKYSNADEK